ncbi:hypothetical protein BCEP4_650031 [Burkholderia cepacia]|nr:hypothetical protein BCEP4_650031 [Burkholderia cepacia]
MSIVILIKLRRDHQLPAIFDWIDDLLSSISLSEGQQYYSRIANSEPANTTTACTVLDESDQLTEQIFRRRIPK